MLIGSQDMEDSGLAISDLMTVLMTIFLLGTLLAIEKRELMSKFAEQSGSKVQTEQLQINKKFFEELEALSENDQSLYWDEKNSVLTAWFKFKRNDSSLTKKVQNSLDVICPKIINVTKNPDSNIEKVVFRGHTDKSWSGEGNKFVGNMRVSFERAMNTMDYCLHSLPRNNTAIASKFMAQGFSFIESDNKLTRGQSNLQRRVEILFKERQN
ncbi:hypothetical protein J8L73_05830 [Pseudoalteromonas sp. MMG006]|uniref:OmpA family protein n=1 Tax=unclassified Pseudoalteromonas TaxID=194690 RepID=UPI001B3811B9|nr:MULTISPECIES: OmpA family protein [unclassified Pseudoalteromonas]MBQ4798648.1 hypothetical protein [Pseudoalteromonas sp. MMG006]MBQ4859172.1 hypothetical protein [Pseudoalteromonas sp. MMG007]